MQYSGFVWPPHVGHYVQVSATGDAGKVVEIEGSGAAQRFIVEIQPRAGDVGSGTLDFNPVDYPERRTHTLAELEPSTTPPD